MKFTISLTIELEGNKPNLLSRLSWKRREKQIRHRDGAICQYCGNPAPNGHVDHIVPLSRGGTDNLDNLAWACSDCNSSKGNKTLQEWEEAIQRCQEAGNGDEDRGTKADPLDPAHVSVALETGKGITWLANELHIGSKKAARVKAFAEAIKATNKEVDGDR